MNDYLTMARKEPPVYRRGNRCRCRRPDHWRLFLLSIRVGSTAVPTLPGTTHPILLQRSARGRAVARRQLRRIKQGHDSRLSCDRGFYALEQWAGRVPRRRRMEVLAGTDRLLRADREVRRRSRSLQANSKHQPSAMRPGILALPRPLARRLERACIVGACHRRRLGRARSRSKNNPTKVKSRSVSSVVTAALRRREFRRAPLRFRPHR